MSSRLHVFVLGLSLIILSISTKLCSQVPDPGVAAQAPVPGSGHHYIGIGAETVNPADGSLTFDLPIEPPAGRGISTVFGIRYSGNEQYYPSNGCGDGAPCNSGSTFGWHSFWEFGNPPYQVGSWSYTLPILTAKTSVFYTGYTYQIGQCPNSSKGFPVPNGFECQNTCYGTNSYVFRGLSGTQYSLPLATIFPDPQNVEVGFCPASPNNVTSPGNSHGILSSLGTSTSTVIDPSGTSYQFQVGDGDPGEPQAPNYAPANWGLLATSIVDRNGNTISLNTAQSGYVDSTGRTAVAWTGIGNDGDQITISGLVNSANNDAVPVTIRWGTTNTTFPETATVAGGSDTCTLSNTYLDGTVLSGYSVPTYSLPVISEIDLPNGQKYTFEYNQTYGKVSQINFPDGGYVSYTWGLNQQAQLATATWTIPGSGGNPPEQANCSIYYDVPAITDRYVSFNGSTQALHQHFVYSTTWNGSTVAWTTKTTTVTSTDEITGQVTTTNYTYGYGVPDSNPYGGSQLITQLPVENTVDYKDGNGTEYEQVNNTWLNPNVMIGDQTILYDGNGNPSVGSATGRCYDANEQVTNLYEYGYQTDGTYKNDSCSTSSGLNTSYLGPVLRQTTNVFHPFFTWNGSSNPPSWSGTHIVNAPDSVTVADGSGNTAKQSLFTYDVPTLQGSGAINLSNPGTTRANITTLKQWISGSSYATTTYQYYNTGQVYTRLDPCGNVTCSDMIGSNHTTYYYYSDAYASGTGTPPGQTFAYLTKVTDPLGHINSFTWGFNDGQIRSHKDPNNQTATYAYNDSGFLARLTQISDPDGGQTYVGYNDSAASMTVCKLLNTTGSTSACPVSGASSGNWVVNTTVRDGMSHTSQTQLTSDPVSTDYGNTLYDGFGRVYQQSNPTHCSSSPGSLPSSCSETTWGKTQTTYDTIGRKILQVNQDSTSQSWSYSGKTVTFTDENGNQWQRATDALGRLSSVLEPSGSSTAPSLETDYTYDVLGNLLSVKQNGVKGQDTARNRSFTYDALSRLLTSSNPESGAITYAYDANGNMSSKVSPAVNQTSGTQTMYYCYEPLNRLTYKFLYGGTLCSVSTPFPTSTHASEFAYDGAVLSGSTVSSPSFKNPIGHVTDEQDFQNGVLTFERVTPQFDAMGRFLQEYQSDYPNPANGARDQYQFTNTYDLAGDMTQWNNGSVVGSSTSVPALTFSAAYDGVARLSLLQATNPSSWGGYTWGSNTTSFPEYLVNLSSKSPAAYDPFSHIAYEEAGKTTSSATSGTAGLTISSSYDKRARIVSENALGYDNSGSALNSFGVIAVTGTEQSGDTGYVNVTLTDTNTSSETYGQVLATTSNVAWGSSSTPTSIVSALIPQINSSMSKWIIPTKDDTDGTIGLASSTTDVNYGIELNVTDTANKAASFEFDFSSLAGGTAGANNNYTIYNYTVPPGGYAPNGNLLASSDMVMGDFAFQYDTLNRLTVIAPSENVGWGYSLGCYLYDSFGNRTLDVVIWDSINNGCTGYPTSDDSVYNSNNQVTTFVEEQYNLGSSPPSTQTTYTVKYDVAGNVTSDGINNYYYDAEGRLCALTNPLAGTAEGYLYDAGGSRVAKGTINTLNCNIASGGNGFQMTNEFLLGPAGNQVTEINNTNPTNADVWAWAHSNVWAGANLDATYDWMTDNQTGNAVAALHFHLSDPLGTRRVQTDPLGGFQAQFYSLPFGDQYGYEIYTANEHADDATEQHFTSQERDWETGNGPTSSGVQETGNDYFGARYYASTMGRFMSPDPSQLDYADQTNPQSLNLYSYVRNNPLINTDPSGMECVWDDGSYDSNDDPDTGNGGGLTGVGTRDYAPGQGPGQQRCSAAGGTWVDHSFFAPLGLPDWLSADNAPDSGGTDQIALYLAGLVKGCTDKILGDISAEFGSGLTTSDVTGNFLNGGAVNINLHATNLPAALYSSIHAGRQPSFIGPSLHLPDGPTKPGGLDPYALKFSKQPADKSVVTTAHIDSAYASAFNPVGAAIHGIVDVAGHDTRNPCP